MSYVHINSRLCTLLVGATYAAAHAAGDEEPGPIHAVGRGGAAPGKRLHVANVFDGTGIAER